MKAETDTIMEMVQRQGMALHAKSSRPPKFPEVEARVLNFVHLARAAKMPVTQDVIRQRALLARDELLASNRTDIDKEEYGKFAGSVGWVQKFVQCHEQNSVLLLGQSASADTAGAAEDIAKLRRRLSEFDIASIYNVDETELFYKLLPKRSYILRTENRKTLRCVKAMKSKYRITAYVCTNANCEYKVPLAIIGTAKNPRAFRLGRCPIPYFSNRTAWSDGVTFRKWSTFVFLPHVRRTKSGKVPLIVDNASSHGKKLIDPRGQVEVIPLPPNVTSLL